MSSPNKADLSLDGVYIQKVQAHYIVCPTPRSRITSIVGTAMRNLHRYEDNAASNVKMTLI